MLRISIRELSRLVDLSAIPFRLHSGRKKRLYYIEDLRAYAKSLGPRMYPKDTPSLPGQPAESSHRHWGPKTHTERGDDEHWVTG